jgi:hypothetical protein
VIIIFFFSLSPLRAKRSESFCQCKVGREISKWRAIKKANNLENIQIKSAPIIFLWSVAEETMEIFD